MKTSELLSVLILCFSANLCAQKLLRNGKDQTNHQNISLERLKSATTVEDLLDSFPKEQLQIVSCHISIAGKDIKYQEYHLADNSVHTNLSALFQNAQAGNKIYVEQIRVQKINTRIAPEVWAPYSLLVTE